MSGVGKQYEFGILHFGFDFLSEGRRVDVGVLVSPGDQGGSFDVHEAFLDEVSGSKAQAFVTARNMVWAMRPSPWSQ